VQVGKHDALGTGFPRSLDFPLYRNQILVGKVRVQNSAAAKDFWMCLLSFWTRKHPKGAQSSRGTDPTANHKNFGGGRERAGRKERRRAAEGFLVSPSCFSP